MFSETNACNENHQDVDLSKCSLGSSDGIYSVEWLLLVDLKVEIGNEISTNAGVYYNYIIVFSFFVKTMS